VPRSRCTDDTGGNTHMGDDAVLSHRCQFRAVLQALSFGDALKRFAAFGSASPAAWFDRAKITKVARFSSSAEIRQT
jgi:hypothetical protein